MLKDLIGKKVQICVKFISTSLYGGPSPETFFGVIKDVDDHFCKVELITETKYQSIKRYKKEGEDILYININDIALVYVQ